MNQQTVAETHRIIAVLNDLVDDLKILSCLPHDLSSFPQGDLKALCDAFRDDSLASSEVQSQIEEFYASEHVIAAPAAIPQDGNIIVAPPKVPSEEDIADHHLNVRSLLDTLRQAAFGSRKDFEMPRSDTIDQFLKMVVLLRGLLNQRLSMTVEDDVLQFITLNDTVNREKTASADVQALNKEFENEKESRRLEVEKRNSAIERLKNEISRLRASAEAELGAFQRSAGDLYAAVEVKFAQWEEDLVTLCGQTEDLLQALMVKNREREKIIRQARTKKEKGLSEVLKHYDTEMQNLTQQVGELSTEIDSASKTYTTVTAQLSELESESARFKVERLNRELRDEHNAQLEEQANQNACIIQAFIRAFFTRLDITSKKRKEKGKKKK